MSWPSIDHTILSPSGRVSKRARKAAMDRETARLFPPGYFAPKVQTGEERKFARATQLRLAAARLLALADRGMSSRKFTRAAEQLIAEADSLE